MHDIPHSRMILTQSLPVCFLNSEIQVKEQLDEGKNLLCKSRPFNCLQIYNMVYFSYQDKLREIGFDITCNRDNLQENVKAYFLG